MISENTHNTGTGAGDATLDAYRERIIYPMGIAGVLFLLPFSINGFVRGNYALAAAVAAVVISLAVDSFAIHTKRRPPIPFALLLLPMAAGISISLATQGSGALWCYPVVLFSYFALSRAMAHAASVTLLVSGSVLIYYYVGSGVLIRFSISLVLTIVIVNILLNVVNELQGKLLALAITDPLTGALNRRQMELSLSDAIERSGRTGARGSLLLIDIDNFKRVNDQFGHDAGDAVLKGIVMLAGQRLRRLDRLFRMGGEEFLLFLPDTGEDGALAVAEHLCTSIADARFIPDDSVTVSIGVSEYKPGMRWADWVKEADDAMYVAKKMGRNRVVAGPLDSMATVRRA